MKVLQTRVRHLETRPSGKDTHVFQLLIRHQDHYEVNGSKYDGLSDIPDHDTAFNLIVKPRQEYDR